MLADPNQVSIFSHSVLPSVNQKENDAKFPCGVFWELQMQNALKALRNLFMLHMWTSVLSNSDSLLIHTFCHHFVQPSYSMLFTWNFISFCNAVPTGCLDKTESLVSQSLCHMRKCFCCVHVWFRFTKQEKTSLF